MFVSFAVSSGSFVYDMDFKIPDWSPSQVRHVVLLNYRLCLFVFKG